MIAAPKSGSGKTMFTCGLLNLLKRSGLDVTSFKCGPDYIDPMFHKRVLGIYGGNLDTFFCSHDKVRNILGRCGHEYAVIEGVMGIYDGLGGLLLEGSSYDVAAASNTPIVLVVDALGAGRTLLSTIKGILADDDNRLIKGIILNKVSSSFYGRLKELVEKGLEDSGFDVKVLGYLPKLSDVSVDSRHLGLMMPGEVEQIREKIDLLSDSISKYCDVEGLISVMEGAEDMAAEGSSAYGDVEDDPNNKGKNVRLAVAMDDAFCFYYKENLELLESLGAELCFFSPLKDEKLPEGAAGLYIGGGYPELHLKELEENESMRRSIKVALESGMPAVAECGGFMYLHESIRDDEGVDRCMVGAIKGGCSRQDHLVRFGYVELDTNDGAAEGSFAGALKGMRGHEFHYYDTEDNGSDMKVRKAGSDLCWDAMHVGDRQVFGFPHMYFPSAPEFAKEFVKVMTDGRG